MGPNKGFFILFRRNQHFTLELMSQFNLQMSFNEKLTTETLILALAKNLQNRSIPPALEEEVVEELKSTT